MVLVGRAIGRAQLNRIADHSMRKRARTYPGSPKSPSSMHGSFIRTRQAPGRVTPGVVEAAMQVSLSCDSQGWQAKGSFLLNKQLVSYGATALWEMAGFNHGGTFPKSGGPILDSQRQ